LEPKRLLECAPEVQAAAFINDENTLNDRPVLALLVAEIISTWSMVEGMEALAFLMLSGSEGKKAVAIYSQLKGRFAREALCALAKELSDAERHIFFAALRNIDRVKGQRDLLAHGVIGHNSADPSILVVIPQAAMLSHMRSLFLEQHLVRTVSEQEQIKAKAMEAFKANAVVYSETDLQEIVKECRQAHDLMRDIAVLVCEVHPLKDATRQRLRERFPTKNGKRID